ncbi:conserved Plasmodium protein, unknown function [Plasmodium ovale curtisi]|uniref:Uncharacterized protein n=1 Tax=Plasmodium ovale curtisi TaxID=864141 RepID=A0A1A8VNH0_PLAOA|nr:conserved Plasmodium protein, unknown function [Plasmodium ovale curtisi]
MGIKHDFLSGNFLGYSFEENRIMDYTNFNLKRKTAAPLKNVNTCANGFFNNSEDYAIELNELREYKRLTIQKIKKYESSVYSYKTQIRNLKKNRLQDGEVNIQLMSVFVNAICDIVEHLCSDTQQSVLSALPLIHVILSSTPVRDKKIYQCSKLIHMTLTRIGNENVTIDCEQFEKERENKNYGFTSHKLQDLEWLASETNDKGWLTIVDRWELCRRDLKWLCVKTNNRSWLLYRHLWEKSSSDLKYIAVLLDDKKWLHLHNVWKFVPLSLKLRAILLGDPSICKPSLREIALNADLPSHRDCCCNGYDYHYDYDEASRQNEDTSTLLNVKSNHVKGQPSHKMRSNFLINFIPLHKRSMRKSTFMVSNSKMERRDSVPNEIVTYDLYNAEEKKNIKKGEWGEEEEHGDEHAKAEPVLEILPTEEQIKNEEIPKNVLLNSKKIIEKEKGILIKKGHFMNILKKMSKSFLKNENREGDVPFEKNGHTVLNLPVTHLSAFTENRKTLLINKTKKGTQVDSKKNHTNDEMEKVKIDMSKKGFTQKLFLKKRVPNSVHKFVVSKKDMIGKSRVSTNEESKNLGKKKDENENGKKEQESNKIFHGKISPLGKNPAILMPRSFNVPHLLEKQNANCSKVEIPKKMKAPSVKNLAKIKKPNFGKFPVPLKKGIPQERAGAEASAASSEASSAASSAVTLAGASPIKAARAKEPSNTSSEERGESEKKDVSTTGICAGKKNLPKTKQNEKRFPITLKKKPSKENEVFLNKSSESEIVKTDDAPNERGMDMGDNTLEEMEDLKKDPRSNVGNYISDLFNAFNFVTHNKVHQVSEGTGDNEERLGEQEGEKFSRGESESSSAERSVSFENEEGYINGRKLFPPNEKKEDLNEGKRRENVTKNGSSYIVETKKIRSTVSRSLRTVKSSIYSVDNNFKGYSLKRLLSLKGKKTPGVDVKIPTQGLEDELEENNTQNYGNQGKKKNSDEPSNGNSNIVINVLDINKVKSKPNFFGKHLQKLSKKKPSPILQKVLDSDMSNFNTFNKRITADEIAKLKNASLHISLKRKATLSSLKMKQNE